MELDVKKQTNHRLRIREITKITSETPTIKTFWFEDENDLTFVPGQFVMVWLPGVDEIPMSVSYSESKSKYNNQKAITVASVGEATTKLHELTVGSKIGIRGPYGHGFNIMKADVKRILAVGGGCGSAPLGPLLDSAHSSGKDVLFALGARNKSELLFKDRAMKLGIELDISTDDGSEGYHGFVTDRVDKLLSEPGFDLVVACGPEIMMKKVVELALNNNTNVQVSLERYMKCGVGICDSCTLGGYQVCRDGPVFDGKLLIKLPEFGISKRDPCGRNIDI